jgi:hypothetical protein
MGAEDAAPTEPPAATMLVAESGVDAPLVNALAAAGIASLTPIQTASLPHLLGRVAGVVTPTPGCQIVLHGPHRVSSTGGAPHTPYEGCHSPGGVRLVTKTGCCQLTVF